MSHIIFNFSTLKFRFLPKNPEKEYTKWKTAKNEELSKKRQQRKEQKQREAEADLRKKIEAEKVGTQNYLISISKKFFTILNFRNRRIKPGKIKLPKN